MEAPAPRQISTVRNEQSSSFESWQYLQHSGIKCVLIARSQIGEWKRTTNQLRRRFGRAQHDPLLKRRQFYSSDIDVNLWKDTLHTSIEFYMWVGAIQTLQRRSD